MSNLGKVSSLIFLQGLLNAIRANISKNDSMSQMRVEVDSAIAKGAMNITKSKHVRKQNQSKASEAKMSTS